MFHTWSPKCPQHLNVEIFPNTMVGVHVARKIKVLVTGEGLMLSLVKSGCLYGGKRHLDEHVV